MWYVRSISTGDADGAASVTQLAAWMDLTCQVLESLATHSFRWNETEYERFRQGVDESLSLLRGQPNPSSVLISAGNLSQRIEHYHRSTQQMVDSSISEFHNIIRVLLSSVQQLNLDCEDSSRALNEIEEMIVKTSAAEELRIAKAHLTQALGRLAETSRERQDVAYEMITGLQEQVLILERSLSAGAASMSGESLKSFIKQPVPARENKKPSPAPEEPENPLARRGDVGEVPLDPLTGLPSKEAAENAILGLKANSAGIYVAAFYVQRLAQINARMGDKIGNELIFLSAQRILNALSPHDQLFRWRGPAFVALLGRKTSVMDVRREIQHIVASRFQFDLRGGAALVSVNVVAEWFPAETHNCGELIHEIEAFLSVSATRG
jgi:GGDEF domain-containing protein